MNSPHTRWLSIGAGVSFLPVQGHAIIEWSSEMILARRRKHPWWAVVGHARHKSTRMNIVQTLRAQMGELRDQDRHGV